MTDRYSVTDDVQTATRDAITRLLYIEDEPQPVDLCIVLGCPTISNMDPAIELYRSGLTPRLLVTGRGPDPSAPPEWQTYRDYALTRGVPSEAILIEDSATNTLENFARSATIIERDLGWHNVRTVAVATKPFHTRRALMTARRQWPGHVRLIFRPSREPDDLPADTWWQTEVGRRYVFSELRAIGTYALAGDLGM